MPFVDLTAHPITSTAYGRWQALNARAWRDGLRGERDVCDPGEAIDTAHDETDSGQHEVYIVVAGRIEFTLGDEIHDAGPGTIVAAPDPAVPRGFRPLEPGTRVDLRRRGAGSRRAGLRRMDRPGGLVD